MISLVELLDGLSHREGLKEYNCSEGAHKGRYIIFIGSGMFIRKTIVSRLKCMEALLFPGYTGGELYCGAIRSLGRISFW